MATNSILKSIDIRDKYLGRKLVCALENAEKKSSKEVVMSKKTKEIKKDQILKLFGE